MTRAAMLAALIVITAMKFVAKMSCDANRMNAQMLMKVFSGCRWRRYSY